MSILVLSNLILTVIVLFFRTKHLGQFTSEILRPTRCFKTVSYDKSKHYVIIFVYHFFVCIFFRIFPHFQTFFTLELDEMKTDKLKRNNSFIFSDTHAFTKLLTSTYIQRIPLFTHPWTIFLLDWTPVFPFCSKKIKLNHTSQVEAAFWKCTYFFWFIAHAKKRARATRMFMRGCPRIFWRGLISSHTSNQTRTWRKIIEAWAK